MVENKQLNQCEPIRIAQIIGKMCAGGVEAVVFNYYRYIDKTKVQFDFYYDGDSTVEPPRDLIEMGARFYKIPPYQKIFKYLPTLRKHFKENKYKIVHSHMNSLSVFPLCMAWLAGVPIRIAHSHSAVGGKEIKRNLLKNFLQKFSRIFSTNYFACSEKAGRWLFGNRCYNKGKVTLINNAIDFDVFANNSSYTNDYIEKYGLQDKFVVGHIGRLTFAKNHKFLFRIFKEILNENSNAVLMLVGDGELYQELIDEAKSLNIENSIIFVGKVSNPEDYYKLMDIMILPSFFEGFPVVAIECQVSGVPILISDAVTKTVIISNGCKQLSLNDTEKVWADSTISFSATTVELNSTAKSFNIKEVAPKLTKMYLSL